MLWGLLLQLLQAPKEAPCCATSPAAAAARDSCSSCSSSSYYCCIEQACLVGSYAASAAAAAAAAEAARSLPTCRTAPSSSRLHGECSWTCALCILQPLPRSLKVCDVSCKPIRHQLVTPVLSTCVGGAHMVLTSTACLPSLCAAMCACSHHHPPQASHLSTWHPAHSRG
jgi:hypothetical protein